MEVRKDYIMDWYVIISSVRGNRPYEFKNHDENVEDKFADKCFFCPGNESNTINETGHIGDPWRIRWFPNKYEILASRGNPFIKTDNKFFTYSDAYGFHEVIVETNEHTKQLYDFQKNELEELFQVYASRITDFSSKEHIKYVLVFKNHGKEAGSSIRHTHSQVLALNHIPEHISEELKKINCYDSCPYCEILNIEKNSDRRCFENMHFVAFTPYASRFNYELWIFPKKHILSITQLGTEEMNSLAEIMQEIFSKLKILGSSYNMFIHNSPENFLEKLPEGQKHGLHFQIEITPRVSIWGGLEEGGGTFVNTIGPEEAAKFYRGDKSQ